MIIPPELLQRIREAFSLGKYSLSEHAYLRMNQRNILPQIVRFTVLEGQPIEFRVAENADPVVLFAWSGENQRAVHVVVTEIERNRQKHLVITVYEPDLDQWDSGFTIRER
jgi:hypothetical protein